MEINTNDAFYDDLKSSLDYSVNQSLSFGDYNNIAFIENEEDERFWKYIFKQLNPEIKVEFHSYFRRKKKDDENSVSQGKQQVLKFKNHIQDYNGQVLLCIDSDFDYILNREDINNNPYILQTYVYSVENYLCCAKSLNELCADLLFPTDAFDFVKFYSNFSQIINDLFIYHIILKHTHIDEDSKIKEVYRTITSDIINIKTLDDFENLYTQNILLNNVKVEIERIQLSYPDIIKEFDRIKQKIESDEKIINNMLHMYINGHLIYSLTSQILKKISKIVLNKKISEAKSLYKGTQLSDKINELKNKEKDIDSVLDIRYNYCYKENLCPNFFHIIEDLKLSQEK